MFSYNVSGKTEVEISIMHDKGALTALVNGKTSVKYTKSLHERVHVPFLRHECTT